MPKLTKGSEFETIVAALLRRRRHELQMTQEDVWKQAGFVRKTYGGIEMGEIRPSLQHLVIICPLLKMSVASLISQAEEHFTSGRPVEVIPKHQKVIKPVLTETEGPSSLLYAWMGSAVPDHLEKQHAASAHELRRRNYQRDTEDSPELCGAHEE